jgi:hypothetical protein
MNLNKCEFFEVCLVEFTAPRLVAYRMKKIGVKSIEAVADISAMCGKKTRMSFLQAKKSPAKLTGLRYERVALERVQQSALRRRRADRVTAGSCECPPAGCPDAG